MATALLEKAAPVTEALVTEATDILRKLWTRDEYRKLIANGYLQESKYELVLGEIFRKMGQGRWHIIIGMRIIKIMTEVFGFDRLQSQSTLALGEYGDPEPDLAVLKKNIDQYVDQEPSAEDTVLLVEVSVSTLNFDLTNKLRQYGSQSIPEYWVIDIPNRLLHVFHEPTEGGYASETILSPNDEVRPLAAPDSPISVATLLP